MPDVVEPSSAVALPDDPRPPDRWARRFSILAWAGACLLAIAGVAFWGASGYAPLELRFVTPLGYLGLVAATLTQATSGLILRLRRPDLIFGGLILVFAWAIGLAGLANGLVPWARARGQLELAASTAWLSSGIAFTAGTLAAQLLGLLFPTGRLISPRWAWSAIAVALASAVYALVLLFTPGPLWLFPGIVNPIAPSDPTEFARLVRDVLAPMLSVLATASVGAAFVIRLRTAGPIERLQIRWYLVGGLTLVAGAIAYVVALTVLPTDHPLGQAIVIVFYLSSSLPPLAIVFGILRYRLYDIDRIVNRAVVLGILTALLAGLYAASIRLFNAVFVALTGESSEAALVLTTLVLATTFTPLKSRLEKLAARWSHAERAEPAEPAEPAGSAGVVEASPMPIERAELERLVEATVRRVLAEETREAQPARRTPRR